MGGMTRDLLCIVGTNGATISRLPDSLLTMVQSEGRRK